MSARSMHTSARHFDEASTRVAIVSNGTHSVGKYWKKEEKKKHERENLLEPKRTAIENEIEKQKNEKNIYTVPANEQTHTV